MIHTKKQIEKMKKKHFIYGILWVALSIFWVYYFSQIFTPFNEPVDLLEEVSLPPIKD
tara:strand:- start:198 stop:371 length:174 start_codon:yes stop_codon:yes gene_type:complete